MEEENPQRQARTNRQDDGRKNQNEETMTCAEGKKNQPNVNRLPRPFPQHSKASIQSQNQLQHQIHSGDEGDRTPDPDTASVVLSQLSYIPMIQFS